MAKHATPCATKPASMKLKMASRVSQRKYLSRPRHRQRQHGTTIKIGRRTPQRWRAHGPPAGPTQRRGPARSPATDARCTRGRRGRRRAHAPAIRCGLPCTRPHHQERGQRKDAARHVQYVPVILRCASFSAICNREPPGADEGCDDEMYQGEHEEGPVERRKVWPELGEAERLYDEFLQEYHGVRKQANGPDRAVRPTEVVRESKEQETCNVRSVGSRQIVPGKFEIWMTGLDLVSRAIPPTADGIIGR